MMLFGSQAAARQLARPLGLPQPVVARAQAARGSRRLRICAQATNTNEEVVDENIGAYCSLDEAGQRPTKELSTAEKEQLFLEAMAAYYYDKQPVLSNEEFDNLKEELTWEGSKVVVMSSDEKRFLEARLAFYGGKPPIMSDAEYDALKEALKESSIFVSTEAPACSLGNAPGKRGQNVGDAEADYLKMAALNVPPVLAVLGVTFGVYWLGGIKASQLLELPEPYGVLLIWGILVPAVYVISNSIANFLFKDALILKAPCPNCGEVNTTYFGDILTVAGNRDQNTVTCPCCESKLTFDAQRREVTVKETVSA